MKWFQLDTDMPEDPRIREVIARMGNEGLGALVRIWCFVANHGIRPGISVDRNRRPIQKQALIEASGLENRKFSDLMAILGENGHIKKNQFLKKGLVVFPAMAYRADTYEKYRLRRNFEVSSKFRRVQDKTRQDKEKSARPRAFASSEKSQPKPTTRCQHQPRCSTIHDCIDRTLAEARKERVRKGK